MSENKKLKPAKKPAKDAFINATDGVRGLIAGMLRPIFGVPEPRNQR
ncbi:MAG: hypothetical protein IKP05_02850 [Alphaproteobacteria bacterium]|nr:hypothetical protein [Alphaproteobacteria bacterium]